MAASLISMQEFFYRNQFSKQLGLNSKGFSLITSSCCSMYWWIQFAWACWKESKDSSSLQPFTLTETLGILSLIWASESSTEGTQSSLAVDRTPTEPASLKKLDGRLLSRTCCKVNFIVNKRSNVIKQNKWFIEKAQSINTSISLRSTPCKLQGQFITGQI